MIWLKRFYAKINYHHLQEDHIMVHNYLALISTNASHHFIMSHYLWLKDRTEGWIAWYQDCFQSLCRNNQFESSEILKVIPLMFFFLVTSYLHHFQSTWQRNSYNLILLSINESYIWMIIIIFYLFIFSFMFHQRLQHYQQHHP